MNAVLLNLATDVVCITIVSYGIYFRRYYRRDLLLAYIALNVGIFAVTALLSDSSAGVGLGLGLFGILSIVRLRSDSITQEEIAYYFVALALGLIGGLTANPEWLGPVLSVALVVVMYVVDHPRLTARAQRQTIILDRAYPDRVQLQAALENLLGAEIRHLVVERLDLVADTTIVDVRFKSPSIRARGYDAVVVPSVGEVAAPGADLAPSVGDVGLSGDMVLPGPRESATA